MRNTNGTTDPTSLTQTTTHITNHVVGMTKTSMIITTIDEKNNTNQNDQPHQEMYDRNGNIVPDEIVAFRFENYDNNDEEDDN